MRQLIAPALAAMLLLSACDSSERAVAGDIENDDNATTIGQAVKSEAQQIMAPLEPPAPGTPGGLPASPAVVSEGAIDPASAQGAAQIVQNYYGLLEAKRFPDAQMLWNVHSDKGQEPPAIFVTHFRDFSEIHANIGAPGQVEGAAGSLYVTVPVQLYGRIAANGRPYYKLRSVTLKRVNDVPGSAERDREWHIMSIGPFTAGPDGSTPS